MSEIMTIATRPAPTCRLGLRQEARRLRRRRSRSDRPAQIPNRSSLASAYSRHSAWTVQAWQMRLAARVEPPFSGKKQSASLSRHAACSYQGWISTGMGAIHCLLNRCSEASGSHGHAWLERHDRNYIGGILRWLEWQFQAQGLFSVDRRHPAARPLA